MTQNAVLVTGGAGYIGSHTVRALRRGGRDVVVLDSLELGRADAVLGVPLVVGNITDQDLVVSTCKEYGVTEVVHFAAYKSVGESMVSPAKYWRNNVAGTVELLEACLAGRRQGRRLLLFVLGVRHAGTGPRHRVGPDSRPRASMPKPRRRSNEFCGGTARPPGCVQ